MQTFLPYDDFEKTAQCLDFRRLGKQRVEAYQIINTIEQGSRWQNHPAVKMWVNYVTALKLYCNTMIKEWKRQGYNNTMQLYPIEGPVEMPDWFGHKQFHSAHRGALLFKDFDYYKKFGWKEEPKIEYIWMI